MSEDHAKRIFRELQTLARTDYGGNTGPLLVVYAVEGFLRRLSRAKDDGLSFDTSSITTEVTRENAEYQGVRVKLVAHLATARMTTTLDFSFGDLPRSTVIDLPELLATARGA